MVDKDRLIPGIFVFLFIAIFFFFNLDIVLIASFFLLIIYDLYKSNLYFKNSILINPASLNSILLLVTFFLIIFSDFDNKIIIFLFILLFSSYFLFKKLRKFIFISLLVLFLIASYKMLKIDREIFFLIFFLSFINDTSAFFFGRFFKGKLIIPNISPKKTWSGTISSFFISFCLMYIISNNIIFSFFIAISFFLGDIFFSHFKRNIGIKDFSDLLKGHGGVLDRIDSVFFTFFLYLIYLN